MNTDNRYPVSASLFMLREMKHRQEKVNRGYQVLKRKAEALRLRGRQAAVDLTTTQALLGHTLREAYMSLAAIKFTNGESNALVLENVGEAQVRVKRIPENISGVSTVSLQTVEVSSVGDVLKYAGLASGGHRTAEAKRAFRETLIILLKFASLRNTCRLLDEALKATLRKLNGIEKVIMPKLRNTESYILREIDEREREEFHRLKMVKAKKNLGQLLPKTKSTDISRNDKTENGHLQLDTETDLITICPSVHGCSSVGSTDFTYSDFFVSPHHWDDEDLLF